MYVKKFLGLSSLLPIIFGVVYFAIDILRPIKGDDNVTIRITANVPVSDVFQLYYSADPSERLSEEYSILKEVSGLQQDQQIDFLLPDSLDITRLRFDVGRDPEQLSISIRDVSFSKGGSSESISLSELQPNEFIIPGPGTNLKLQPVQGRFDPFFSAGKRVIEQYGSIRLKQPHTRILLSSLLVTLLIFVGLLSTPLKAADAMDYIFIFTFAMILLLPGLDNIKNFSINSVSTEKRTLAEKPNFSASNLAAYPQQYETYFTDHFGFRNLLIRWGSHLKTRYFKVSSNPKKVIFGKDNWIFYTGENGNILRDIRRENLLLQDELDSRAQALRAHIRALDSLHIKYYKAVWPDKHTIYADKLPFILQFQRVNKLSKTDQLIQNYERAVPGLRIIDIRKDLIEKRESNQLYLKNDTHWNSYGAYYGYHKLMERIGADFQSVLPVHDTLDFDISWNKDSGGDLIEMMGMTKDEDFEDLVPSFRPRNDQSGIIDLPTDGYPALTVFHKNSRKPGGVRALVFRDSYSNALIEFMSTHFAEVLYVRVGYDQNIVNSYKPDLVVEAFVERVSN